MTLKRPSIQTARLLLRPYEISNAPELKRLVGDAAIADTTINIPHPYEDGMAETWIARCEQGFDEGSKLALAVTLRRESILVGGIGLGIVQKHNRGEMAYWIGKRFWNKGYCTEAGQALVKYGFETLLLNRIEALHMTRNPASGRVMQKIGLTYEGKHREHYLKGAIYEDMDTYAILKTDYSATEGA